MFNSQALAAQLSQARRTRSYLDFDKAGACPSPALAYDVQAKVVELLADAVAGWKVGIGEDGIAMAAPILGSDLVKHNGIFELSGDLVSVKVEAELGLRLGHDLPGNPSVPYDRAAILAAVSDVFCGIELVATRFRNDADVDFATRLADNFAHGAYAAGSGMQAFAALDLTALPCRVERDGAVVSDRSGGHPLGDPLLPVVAWANSQCDMLGGLRAGQFITTGTLIEPFAISANTELNAGLTGVGSAHMRVVAKNVS